MRYSMALSFLVALSILSSSSVESNQLTTRGTAQQSGGDTEHEGRLKPDSGSFTDLAPIKTDTLKVIVVQCANGYNYSQLGYSFNHIIEEELNKFDNILVKPFPLKALMGVSYQGVFDKKYCPPIIEKVDADFLVLTRFTSEHIALNRSEMDWGYQLRIVNTSNLKQVNSINAHDLKKYEEIEQHIKDHISTLKTEIENLR